jgi:hypothetical protein
MRLVIGTSGDRQDKTVRNPANLGYGWDVTMQSL